MLCKYPPMGWNSWDCYGASVTEDVVRQNADYMAEHLKPYGWECVVVEILMRNCMRSLDHTHAQCGS